jgi:hypothetical protein
MAKPRKVRDKDATASSVAGLVAALKFVNLASKSIGVPYMTHVRLEHGRAVSFDGTLAAGIAIQDETTACPHLVRLIAALSKCGEQVSITQLDRARLSIRSDRLKAVVECIDPATVPLIGPDPAAVAVDARLQRALALAGTLASEGAPRVVEASVWLTSQYAYGCSNGHLIYRCETGVDLPGNIVIPKAAIKALNSTGKEVSHLGASATSLTFWFDDGSWLRTQTYTDKWPEETVLRLFSTRCAPVTIPVGFFEAIDAVSPFSETDTVYFDSSGIRSDYDVSKGAKYDVSGLPNDKQFSAKYLQLLEDIAEVIDFHSDPKKLYFNGDGVTGILMAKINIEKPAEEVYSMKSTPVTKVDIDETDIPF